MVALAQASGDENGTDQVETAEAAKTNWLERNETAVGAVAALLAIIAYLSGFVSHIKKIILAKLGKKPPESTGPPQQAITLTPEALELLRPKSTEPPGKISNIPLPHNPNFTGRVDLLDRLHAVLTSGQYAAVTQTQAITGLGGVGKTQLALEYTYRHLADYETVWWVKSEEPATLAADYTSLAAKLDLPEKTSPDQNVITEAVRIWLEQNESWLLVFDNAQDPEDLEDYLPRTGAGHVIITSRNPNWGGIVRTLPVDVFSRDESIEFLRNRTRQDDGADALADALGDLPLALEQAGAYIEETGISLSDYLKRFQEQQKEVLERGKPVSYPATVATTWKISFKQVKDEARAGADLLNLCAFLDPDNIPKPLLAGGAEHLPEPLASAVADELKFDDAIAALKRYSLMTVADDSLSVHRLVQAVTRDRLSDEERKGWAAAAARLVNEAFPQKSHDVTTWPECSLLLPHARTAAEHAVRLEVAPEAISHLLNQVGLYLMGRAELVEANSAFERVLAITENVYGPDHLEVARTLNKRSVVLRKLGKYEDANDEIVKALTIFEKADDSDPIERAKAYANFGLVSSDLKNFVGAKYYLELALDIKEGILGPEDVEVAKTLGNLGSVLKDQGDLEGAKEHYVRALEIFEKVDGLDHPNVGNTVGNLGTVLKDQGDLDGAKKCFERALEIYEKAYDPDHLYIAMAANNRGSVLKAQGDLAGAKECFEHALEISRDKLGEDHPYTKTVRGNLEALQHP